MLEKSSRKKKEVNGHGRSLSEQHDDDDDYYYFHSLVNDGNTYHYH